ncbi:MAG: spinster family MFS transporter [Steroidobacteraceae bacterium]
MQSEDRSALYGWYVLVILTVTYTVSFIDRQILSLMIGPIRKTFDISDTQVSLLIGLAFALFYTLLGIPIARLADRYSRRGIIAAGIFTWCVMTAACGLTHSYGQLFVARVGVGVGEAALSPSALSLISDYFPQQSRGKAISFYTMGISLGSGLAMIIGGGLVALALRSGDVTLPVVGALYPWQPVFFVIGIPGLLLAVLMATLKEPRRREALRAAGTETHSHMSLAEVARFVGTRWRLYGSHFLGMSVAATVSYGFFAWIPTMFVRTWDWSIARVGTAYGCVVIISGVLAILLVSWLTKRLAARGCADVYMRVALYCVGLGVVGAVLAPVAPNAAVSLIMLVPTTVGTLAATAAGLAALMVVTPNQMRAQVSALYYLVVNLIGLTLGPTGIALFTDRVFHDDRMLRYSVLCVALLAGALALVFLLYNMRQYRLAFVSAQSWLRAA